MYSERRFNACQNDVSAWVSVDKQAGLQLRFMAIALAMTAFTGCARDATSSQMTLQPDSTWVVDQTTHLQQLTIASGAKITAPPGQEVTLTVDGVETGIRAGTFAGDVVVTPAKENLIEYSFGTINLVHPFRQGLFLDQTGVVTSKSVLAAVGQYALKDGAITGVKIKSAGDNFNGIFAAGGTHAIKNAEIDFSGDGGNDFAGYGAAVMATGDGTTLIVDGARIHTHGVIRSAVVADKGANLVVKNSEIQAEDGKLPADYVPNVDPGHMKSVPWMLGLSGNNRATNLLGKNTQATYINSSISSENWGVLSNDISDKPKLTVINSKVKVNGKSGYGAYSMAGAVTSFYGSSLDVRDYGVIVDAGGNTVLFGASDPETVAKVNAELKLGLTPDELNALPRQGTTVTSDRFGLMLHASVAIDAPPASVKIFDDTVINTGKSVFLIKGVGVNIFVDGDKGAQLNPGNRVIVQVIDSDDPGAVIMNGAMLNQGVYHEPGRTPVRVKGFDVSTAHDEDVHASFSNITLNGDFYNGYRDGTGTTRMGVPATPGGKNIILNFERSSVNGVITAALARHAKDALGAEDYTQLGEVTNTPAPAVNNGVIVSLAESTWTITDTSYLTSLTIDNASTISAPDGARLTMTVDGRATPLKAGTYKGKIVLAVAKH